MRRIAEDPARDLYEALQLVWLTELTLQHESNASSISLGRMDQYLWPYYRASIAAGERDGDIRELIQCFYLKTNTIVFLRSTESAQFFAGFPSGFNLVVGGVDAEGKDCTNDLSYLLLDIQKDTRLPQPNLSLRMHKDTPADLLRKAGEIIRLGDGIPQVFNDEVNIKSFETRGIATADACDYAVVGCVELSIPGRMYGLHDISMFNMVRCLEIALERNPDGFESFEELKSAVKKTISEYIALMVRGCNTCDLAHRETSPTPLLSVFIKDSLLNGRDITAGGARYNPSGVQGVGTANLADSLLVMKRTVFGQAALFEVMEERQVTIDGVSHRMNDLYTIIATQNPVEQEGTYRLPEAQLDRFLFKIRMSYPTLEEEVSVLQHHQENRKLVKLDDIQPLLSVRELLNMRQQLQEVYIEDSLLRYIASIVQQTRMSKAVYLGASPRAAVAMLNASKAYAMLSGRDFVTPEDIKFVTPNILQHRLLLTAEAEMEGYTALKVAQKLIDKVEVPK